MRKFLMTTHVETALASSWQGTMRNQRQVERVTSRAVPEVEIPRLEAGEEVDVGEPMVRVAGTGGRTASSHSSSGADHRAQEPELDQVQEQIETNTDDREAKRVRVAESQGQKKGKVRMWKNWQRELNNHILMPMLRCQHTRHGELKTSLQMRRMQRPNK